MLALSVAEFCTATGISKRTFWNLVKNNDAPPLVRIGRRVVIRTEAAEAWLKAKEQPLAA
jgi:excisionase family DNA binding protein